MYPSRPAPSPPKTAGLPEGHPFAAASQYGYTPARSSPSTPHYAPGGPSCGYAPRPTPSAQRHGDLPAGHPFALQYTPHHANDSTSSFSTTQATPSSYPSSPSSYRRQTSPTSSLASPLCPRPATSPLGSRAYTTPYPSSLTHKPSSSPLPTDLALFDARPRQNLLGDLETIFGKKLTFPLVEKMIRKKDKAVKEKRAARTLKKQPSHSWEEKFAWEGVRLLEEEKVSRRDAREGNWI